MANLLEYEKTSKTNYQVRYLFGERVVIKEFKSYYAAREVIDNLTYVNSKYVSNISLAEVKRTYIFENEKDEKRRFPYGFHYEKK